MTSSIFAHRFLSLWTQSTVLVVATSFALPAWSAGEKAPEKAPEEAPTKAAEPAAEKSQKSDVQKILSAQYQQAIAYKKAGELDKSVELLQKILETDPKHVESLYSLGLIRKSQKKLDEAAVLWERAIQADPNYGSPHLSLGMYLAQQGKTADARTHLTQAINAQGMSDDEKAECWNSIGYTYRLDKDFKNAVTAYDEAIRLAPNRGTYYANKAIALGRMPADAANPDAVLNLYKKAIELEPQSMTSWSNLAIHYRRSSQWDDAAAAYEKAISLGGAADLWFDLGAVRMEQERWQEAADALQKYLDAMQNAGKKSASPQDLQAAQKLLDESRKKASSVAIPPATP